MLPPVSVLGNDIYIFCFETEKERNMYTQKNAAGAVALRGDPLLFFTNRLLYKRFVKNNPVPR
jgi:hypothetical protein